MNTAFSTGMLSIQQKYQNRLARIHSEYATVFGEIQREYLAALESREAAYAGASAAAIRTDELARELKMLTPSFDHTGISETAARIGENATEAAAALLAEIVTQMSNRFAMARELRDVLINDAKQERDARLSALLNSEQSVAVPTVGEPCITCRDSGIREQTNCCAARRIGTVCGKTPAITTDRKLCTNCPLNGGVRPFCRRCPALEQFHQQSVM